MGIGGSTLRRRRRAEEQVELGDVGQQSYYRYPPKVGSFFGSFFSMAGKRLETAKPEAYLFGDNKDLNFLFGKPSPLPGGVPLSGSTCVPLESLVHIQRDTLRIVECGNDSESVSVQFNYDSLVPCHVTVYCGVTESISQGRLVFGCHADGCQSESYPCPAGLGQTYSQDELKVQLKNLPPNLQSLSFDEAEIYYPLVVVMEADLEGRESHCHIAVATLEECYDSGFTAKIIKQQQMVNGVLYVLQDIFGTTQTDNSVEDSDDEDSVSGLECELCLTELRDTIILPCRHLCLCHTCAETLRYSSSSCPFCRSPFVALLHVSALKKQTSAESSSADDGDYKRVNLLPVLNETTSPKKNRSESQLVAAEDNVSLRQHSPVVDCNSSELVEETCSPDVRCHESQSEHCTALSCYESQSEHCTAPSPENTQSFVASPHCEDSMLEQAVYIVNQQPDAASSDVCSSTENIAAAVELTTASSPSMTANRGAHDEHECDDKENALSVGK